MKITAAVVFLLVIAPVVAWQQAPGRIKTIDADSAAVRRQTPGEVLTMPELSALISENGGRIVVDHIMEAQMRPKGYEKTELQEGDVILMANGGRIGSLAGLRGLYDTAAVGSTVNLGVKRKEEMMIASFVKADPKNLPKLRMVISHGDDGSVLEIPQVGLIFGSEGKTIVVREVLPNASGTVHGEVEAGDRILRLNGSALHSMRDFRTAYDKLPLGSRIQLLTSRSGKNRELVFPKPKDDGPVIIRRKSNQ